MMKKKSGFTLIEFVLVIVISGIIATIATKILSIGFTSFLTGKNITDASWQGRLATERMTRDIRAIRSSSDISTATASQLTFTDSYGSSVSYTLSGTTLMLNSNALADGVSSMSFSYYDENGTSTAVINAIRYVRFTLNITQGNTNLTLTSSVYPRNLP